MTAVILEKPTLWSSMPGWGIAADLIPPELINSRQLKAFRRLMAGGVVVLLLLCAGGYYLAARENVTAASDLAAVQDETLHLTEEARLYAGAVSIQGSLSQVESQIAQVMTGDVDLVALLGNLQSSLPTTMTIGQLAITVSPAGVASSLSAGAAAGSVLDTSGLPRIGTIALSGTGHTLNDLSDYIDRLKSVTGLVDLVPVSNTATSGTAAGTQYNLTMGLTGALLSHRFDVAKPTK